MAAPSSACDGITSELEPNTDQVAPEEILRVYRASGVAPLPANGVSQDTIYALLPRDASQRIVTFTTSAGSFAPVPGSTSVKVRAERSTTPYGDKLVARAVIRADTLARTAVVSAEIGEFVRYVEVSFIK
jgi:hypothetical protein